MPYAVHGFFNNGGLVAHVVRVGHGGAVATADWDVGAGLDNRAYLWNSGQTTGWSTTLPSGSARAVLRPVFTSLRYRIEAASPGTWGNQVTVTATFERQGPDGLPRVQLVVRAPDEYPEFLRDLAPYRTPEQEAAGFGPTMANQVKAESNLIRLVPLDDADTPPVEPRNTSAAVNALIAPAVALPDLYTDLADGDDALQVLQAAAALAAATQDRLVLADVPADKQAVRCAVAYAARLRNCLGIDGSLRATVVYHPWLCVVDPYGPPGQPFRAVPPSGHVAGVIARIDRERGPHHTAANVPVFQATDVAATYSADDAGQLNDAGVNLIRPRAALGLQVWGGRTLDLRPTGLYVAHRRLIHSLVRAIRRAAEPVVFLTNGPKLWLMLARAVTSVLLRAFQSGALKGDRPEQAFAVRCDNNTNPPTAVSVGLAVCEIDIAPAVPMEFITLRVAVSAAGRLEVFAP